DPLFVPFRDKCLVLPRASQLACPAGQHGLWPADLSLRGFTGGLIHPPTRPARRAGSWRPSAQLDAGPRTADRSCIRGPPRLGDLLAVLQETQRRPQFHAERAAEAPPAGIGDLDVANNGMVGKRLGDERLCAAAIAAPGAAELQEGRARERIDLDA